MACADITLIRNCVFLGGPEERHHQKTVAELEQRWLKSQQTNDVSLVEPLLADKIVDTSSDGKVVDRAGALAVAKATKYSSAGFTLLIHRKELTA